MTKPNANPIDLHVGARIRLRRLQIDVSQEILARAIGVTFQQVQKYERGANRISASRIHAVARALKTPVGWFFEGLEEDQFGQPASHALLVDTLLATREGQGLAANFQSLKPLQRRCVAALVAAIAEGEDREAA